MASSENSSKQIDTEAGTIDQSPIKAGGLSKKQRELMQSRLLAANFGNMVTVMMQSRHHRHIPLSELHDRLVPALVARQFRVAEVAKEDSGMTIPVGLIVWARVSDELHEKLKQQLDEPILLKADEWTSGENFWIIDVVGAQRFLAPLLTGLRKTDFKDHTVHYRVRSKDGVKIQTLQDVTSPPASKQDTATVAASDAGLNGASPSQQ